MNNEEAIKGLKEDVYNLKNFLTDTEKEKWQQTIDTVLDYIADLEKENAVKESNFKIVSAYNEELEKKNKDLCENYCPKYKELENKLETQTQNYHSAMEDVNYFCGNYVPKSKIRDKIEELETKRKKYGFGSIESVIFLNKVQVLNELLKEEKCQL